MTKNKLYFFVLGLCSFGYSWIYLNKLPFFSVFGGCIFYKVTNIPCPACGSTRAVESLLGGDLIEAIHYNPLGVFSGICAFILPVWIIADLLVQKDSFYRFYNKAEVFLCRKKVAFILITLVLINWIWNIFKYT